MWKPDYLSLAEGKDWLRVTGTAKDDKIASLITAVSRAVDASCKRQFGNVDSVVTRTYRRPAALLRDGSGYLLAIDDLRDDDNLTVTADGTAVTDVTLWPDNAVADQIPARGLLFPSYPYPPYVVSTDRWGWAAVPHGVKNACRVQLNRWYWRQESPAGTAGSPSDGNEVMLLARLDPDLHTSLVGLRRTGLPG